VEVAVGARAATSEEVAVEMERTWRRRCGAGGLGAAAQRWRPSGGRRAATTHEDRRCGHKFNREACVFFVSRLREGGTSSFFDRNFWGRRPNAISDENSEVPALQPPLYNLNTPALNLNLNRPGSWFTPAAPLIGSGTTPLRVRRWALQCMQEPRQWNGGSGQSSTCFSSAHVAHPGSVPRLPAAGRSPACTNLVRHGASCDTSLTDACTAGDTVSGGGIYAQQRVRPKLTRQICAACRPCPHIVSFRTRRARTCI
jgi:hypothetical protein